ncbi:MAG: hypothetical protein ACYDGS_00160 [Thermoleophilia bacterium]
MFETRLADHDINHDSCDMLDGQIKKNIGPSVKETWADGMDCLENIPQSGQVVIAANHTIFSMRHYKCP